MSIRCLEQSKHSTQEGREGGKAEERKGGRNRGKDRGTVGGMEGRWRDGGTEGGMERQRQEGKFMKQQVHLEWGEKVHSSHFACLSSFHPAHTLRRTLCHPPWASQGVHHLQEYHARCSMLSQDFSSF